MRPWVRWRRGPEAENAPEKYFAWGHDPETAPDQIDAIRKEWAQHHEAMAACQKEAGQRLRETGDRTTFEFFKAEAAEALKRYRAACLLLGCIAPGMRGDCPSRPQKDWPEELFPALDETMMRLCHG